MPNISIGDLITDNFGRECLVFSKERRPGAQWLAEQADSRVQKAVGPWWKAFPLTGGAVIVADELGEVVRRATVDELLELIESQSSEAAGHAMLIDLFQQMRVAKNSIPIAGR